jgi:hypothetical protein
MRGLLMDTIAPPMTTIIEASAAPVCYSQQTLSRSIELPIDARPPSYLCGTEFLEDAVLVVTDGGGLILESSRRPPTAPTAT